MSVLVYKDKTIAGAAASTLIAAQIIEKPSSVFGLDFSEELQPVYRAVARMTTDGLLDWSDVRACSLSEYVRADADGSIAARMQSALFDRINIPAENCFAPGADASDWSVVCNEYEDTILDMGGIDMIFLCVRADGSIAFNQGASELAPVTHVERTESGRVVTVGLTTVMTAKKIVAFLVGPDKAEIAGRIFNGPVTPMVPASYLQLHPNAVFLLDEEAAKQV